MRVIDEFLNQTPTAALFHYTTSSGLLGILEQNSIWASSAYHLNDAAEFRYAVNLIIQRLRFRLQHEHGSANEKYGKLLEELQSMTNGVQVFIASFSEQGDLLSQWLAYSGTNGYAVAIDANQASAAVADGFALVRCVYQEADQIRLADAFIDVFCDADDSSDNSAALRKALVVAAAIKHPGFEKEAEWRLVKTFVVDWQDDKVYFRSGRNGIVPYMKAPLSVSGASYVPSMICVGPNADMDAAIAALSTFLSSRGNNRTFRKDVQVVASKTPYRP